MEKAASLAVGIKQFFLQPADARTRMNALAGIVNPLLEEAGVPSSLWQSLQKMEGAAFSSRWGFTFDKGLLGKSVLTEEEFKRVVEYAYHEARHTEQFWMMARRQAGDLKTAKEIAEQLKIPFEVADLAASQPLRKGMPGAEAAEKWLESIYGAGKLHRVTVFKNMDKAAAEVKSLTDVTNDLAKKLKDAKEIGAPKKLIDLYDKELESNYKKLLDAHESLSGWDEAYRKLPEEADAYAVQGRFGGVLNDVFGRAKAAEEAADLARKQAITDAMPSTVRPGKPN
jgi:hypothetical protein